MILNYLNSWNPLKYTIFESIESLINMKTILQIKVILNY